MSMLEEMSMLKKKLENLNIFLTKEMFTFTTDAKFWKKVGEIL